MAITNQSGWQIISYYKLFMENKHQQPPQHKLYFGAKNLMIETFIPELKLLP